MSQQSSVDDVDLQLQLRTMEESLGEMAEEGVELNHSYMELLREHPYLPRFPLSDIRPSPYTLPKGFRWSFCDLTNENTCEEISILLTSESIHPNDLYNNSKEYLRWSLCPPGYFANWHVGVRKELNGTLVAFVSAVPMKIRVRGVVLPMAALHHLYVHSFIEARIPRTILFSEILRRINSKGVWQQVYRTESFLPAPIAVSGLWERELDLAKLGNLLQIPCPWVWINATLTTLTLPDFIKREGIRTMTPSDVPAVTVLLRDYLSQFAVAPIFTEEEVDHWFLPREYVLDSFVIETSGSSHEITDFFSYTRKQSRRKLTSPIMVARSFYFATRKTPLTLLIRNALLMALYYNCSLFVTDDFKSNDSSLVKLGFERTLRKVQYNLNNYPIDVLPSSEVGLSLL